MLGRVGDLPFAGFLIQVDGDKVDMIYLANVPHNKLSIPYGILSRPTQLPYTPISIADINYNYTVAMPIRMEAGQVDSFGSLNSLSRLDAMTRLDVAKRGTKILLLVSTAAPATIVVESLS
ncbi:unnamed protein product [Fusarium venenatum]|uniref:Uncharacterized protein n=1 Tax=Fusarium venenatum TaxID=56646 RepID=A0A2L2TWF9_9HYPO|nr:uncharacterized protein FVRRES_10364 [Fusarium venenatum]CEI70287.1 unnamed protein product [Fusarium venenatum]